MLLTIVIFLIILSILVLIHEAGHFLVAKFFNIKVEEFGYGLPPRAWGKKIGETLYSINWLPIGGFVKLFGEDEAGGGKLSGKTVEESVKGKDTSRAFFARPVGQRAAVVVAGVVMNALLAIVIYYIFLSISGFKTEIPLITDHHFFGVEQRNNFQIFVSGVAQNSPAEKAGLTSNSRIISINNRSVEGSDVKNLAFFSETIAKNKGKKVTLGWQNIETGKKITSEITPRINPPKNEGALGIEFGFAHFAQLEYKTTPQKILSGITHPTNLMIYNMEVIAKLVSVSLKEQTAAPISEGVSGPVGILKVVGAIGHITDVKDRLMQYLNLAGLLSISLAFFNIRPIPALDGGRLFFILIEGVTRKKVNPKFEGYAHSIGMAALVGLILVVTFKDIFQLFK